MNEKKAIELLNEMKRNCIKGMLDNNVLYRDEKAEKKSLAIQYLLDKLENQQNEIEELKKVLECVEKIKDYNLPVVKNESLKEEISFVVMSRKDFLRNWGDAYISKQKIIDKIYECNKLCGNLNIGEWYYKKQILQELLEEE